LGPLPAPVSVLPLVVPADSHMSALTCGSEEAMRTICVVIGSTLGEHGAPASGGVGQIEPGEEALAGGASQLESKL
jgi:hypothetical protein